MDLRLKNAAVNYFLPLINRKFKGDIMSVMITVEFKIKPETGKTFIWPAEWTHAHRGEVLNSGVKYIITGWMHFPTGELNE